MNMITALRVLTLFFFLSLPKTCLAQDWAKPLEASTAPTDYQEILEKNLTAYTPSSTKIVVNNNLSTYEESLAQTLQSLDSTAPTIKVQGQNWSQASNTIPATVFHGYAENNGNNSSIPLNGNSNPTNKKN